MLMPNALQEMSCLIRDESCSYDGSGRGWYIYPHLVSCLYNFGMKHSLSLGKPIPIGSMYGIFTYIYHKNQLYKCR